MTLPVIYGQRDYKDKLGTSTVTISGYGCAITSLAMLLEYCGIHVTPPELNTWLTNNKGYTSGNLVNWNAIDRYTNGKVTFLKSGSTDRYPCIAEVDLIPTNSGFDQHFVVALDKDWCADPWEKRVRLLKDFNGAKSFRVYKLPEVNMGDSEVLEKLRKEADDARKERDRNWNLYQSQLDLTKTANERLSKSEEEVSRLNSKIVELTKMAASKAESDAVVIKDLQDQLEGTQPHGALGYITLALQAALAGKWN